MIVTRRLELIPATPALVRAALDTRAALEAALPATVPTSWPPDLLDRAALEFVLARLAEGPAQFGWWLHFVVLVEGARRVAVGSAGYKGPPCEGAVEVGYAIVGDHQRRGYASEALDGLVARAFAAPAVDRVIAETLPELAPSIGVLHKAGFRLTGEGSEPGVIRFELPRGAYQDRSGRRRDGAHGIAALP